MQTFLPYADFSRCAAVLDPRRLGKQRIEVLQVLRATTVPGYGWRHHPVAKMWAGYAEALICYGLAICRAWTDRGRPDTVAATLVAEVGRPPRGQAELAQVGELPSWLGQDDLHRSHQSALLRKDPTDYRPIFGDASPTHRTSARLPRLAAGRAARNSASACTSTIPGCASRSGSASTPP